MATRVCTCGKSLYITTDPPAAASSPDRHSSQLLVAVKYTTMHTIKQMSTAPRSFCSTMSPTQATANTPTGTSWAMVRRSLRSIARQRISATLTNSEGCSEKNFRSIQFFAP